jgi:hypothetical protein
MELSKEAQLQGENLVKLIHDDHLGLVEVKWSRNQFIHFLVLDPKAETYHSLLLIYCITPLLFNFISNH